MPALWIGAATAIASVALKKDPVGAAPGGMSNAPFTTGFDDSGWTVNIGSGSASATANRTTTTAQSAAGAALLSNPLLIVAVCLLLYYATKHK